MIGEEVGRARIPPHVFQEVPGIALLPEDGEERGRCSRRRKLFLAGVRGEAARERLAQMTGPSLRVEGSKEKRSLVGHAGTIEERSEPLRERRSVTECETANGEARDLDGRMV